MELTEPIESINKQLSDLFGIDTVTGQPIFRVVWSNDQYENRAVNVTDEGLILFAPVVKHLPKYHWIKDRYVLERLVQVPESQQRELADIKISYEPLWTFQSNSGEYRPPKLEVAKFIIDTVYAALGKKSLAKYVDEEAKNPIEQQEMRVNKLIEELFGDESSLLGRTITGEAIIVPGRD